MPQPQPYQEEKHWRMLITHCSFTRDPPQKCTPFLWGEGWGELAGHTGHAAVLARCPLTGCGC